MPATSLSDRAILVSLSITQWSARKHDKDVSAEIAETHRSDINLGRFNKTLIDKAALKPVTEAAGALRQFHYDNTLPWLNDGARILPSLNFFAYHEGHREKRRAFESAVAEFMAAWDQHLEAAKVALNGLFKESDYPSRRNVERQFSVELMELPFPDEKDWRVELGDSEVDRLRSDLQRTIADAAAAANQSLWERCHDTVAAMVERLGSTNDDGSLKIFRDTLVGNVRELVDLLPRLNVTGDANLHAMQKRIADKLASHEAQDLREDTGLRNTVAAEAAAILADMSAYTGIAA